MTESTPPLEPPPSLAVTPNHGPVSSRGLVNAPRSSTETGKFGRLFRTLPPLNLDESQIRAVVALMTDPGDAGGGGGWGGTPSTGDSELPSGYTYLSQFVDHDITFDPTSLLDQANDPDALENFRTPRFDLDCLYGLGPTANPWLYDINDPDKLLIGENADGFATPDLSRNQQGRALIGDPRNDVHVIISQLHLAFARFHNRVVDLVRDDPSLVGSIPATPVGGWGTPATPDSKVTFGQVVTLVRWHYQWIVLTDLLARLVGPDTHAAVLPSDKKGRLKAELELYNVRRKPWMPVEFSAAAYRFGHSLVRDSYLLNSTLSPLPVFSVDGDNNQVADLRGLRRLPQGWHIEWSRFFDGLPESGGNTQHARAFDTKLVPSLHRLPASIDRMNRSLALLNLTRGVALGLPSGEDVAAAVAAQIGLDPGAVQLDTGLAHPAPLWFWLLREAEVKAAGKHLGPIGGRIVAEVLVGLAANDPSSFLKHQPDWKPNLPGTTPGDFTMADVLTTAGG
ncbi:heme peroxidase family protein [Nocardioides KLBMP 9356]|uniref:Heme peroxidase family protein n=1 Tax=Nocardioides potassii TaxID=2911371 RepID=A0ABS9HCP8_9ACTN|nr:heme peroxidase family protein [Nocardioides potassii]MCF6378118.1 heme peroxidase family protein [Nocardioides potassii]